MNKITMFDNVLILTCEKLDKEVIEKNGECHKVGMSFQLIGNSVDISMSLFTMMQQHEVLAVIVKAAYNAYCMNKSLNKPNSEQNPERSVATEVDSSTEAGKQK